MDTKEKFVNWERLIVTTLLVVVASAVTSSITWFILDRMFTDSQQTNATLVENLEKKITFLDTKVNGGAVANPAITTNGTILGKIMYPSEGIPTKIKVFVEDTTTKKTYEATVTYADASKDTSPTATYTVTVPAGSYYVYGTLAGFNDQNGSLWKAYYNQFVICGMAASCKDVTNVAVSVTASKTVENITIGDWYPTK